MALKGLKLMVLGASFIAASTMIIAQAPVASAATRLAEKAATSTANCKFMNTFDGFNYIEEAADTNVDLTASGSSRGSALKAENVSPSSESDCWKPDGSAGEDGLYWSEAIHYGGLCINISGASKRAGAHAILWTCNGATNEVFKEVADPDNCGFESCAVQFYIPYDGLCLDPTSGLGAGSVIAQEPCGGAGDIVQDWVEPGLGE
jgi:hypothetical protein